ncbi:hypothetical protein [Leptospira kanakyensis]|uniref:Uncharacterized protein n=2 Tax=Leptospira kanakyensis TaxID=2484968 RepID=A0A6N4Q8E9_9LEPT|nr:hypothetical protein [Leptospira kanakyensis]MCW7470989.1 hypothetical protein [Leptospira kanakyensis]MCW7483095.1 hypothetical protein [Leptospira kanakyensis]TGK54340.1 hypothetical protein EHQ11_01930 [Leptospira kanakyensis]TGK58940.1 hypothetical protein EHQ16_11305 [Leptospira kanakyensis]TGK75340.1 hypothetical protein EHQ18_03360 [Leptospira kanakyensis]
MKQTFKILLFSTILAVLMCTPKAKTVLLSSDDPREPLPGIIRLGLGYENLSAGRHGFLEVGDIIVQYFSCDTLDNCTSIPHKIGYLWARGETIDENINKITLLRGDNRIEYVLKGDKFEISAIIPINEDDIYSKITKQEIKDSRFLIGHWKCKDKKFILEFTQSEYGIIITQITTNSGLIGNFHTGNFKIRFDSKKAGKLFFLGEFHGSFHLINNEKTILDFTLFDSENINATPQLSCRLTKIRG